MFTVVEQGNQSALRGPTDPKPTCADHIKWPVGSEQVQLLVKTLFESDCSDSTYRGMQRLLRYIARTPVHKELVLELLSHGLQGASVALADVTSQWVELCIQAPDKSELVNSGQLQQLGVNTERQLLRGLKAMGEVLKKDNLILAGELPVK